MSDATLHSRQLRHFKITANENTCKKPNPLSLPYLVSIGCFITALSRSGLSLGMAINITEPCTTLKYHQFSSTAPQTLDVF